MSPAARSEKKGRGFRLKTPAAFKFSWSGSLLTPLQAALPVLKSGVRNPGVKVERDTPDFGLRNAHVTSWYHAPRIQRIFGSFSIPNGLTLHRSSVMFSDPIPGIARGMLGLIPRQSGAILGHSHSR